MLQRVGVNIVEQDHAFRPDSWAFRKIKHLRYALLSNTCHHICTRTRFFAASLKALYELRHFDQRRYRLPLTRLEIDRKEPMPAITLKQLVLSGRITKVEGHVVRKLR